MKHKILLILVLFFFSSCNCNYDNNTQPKATCIEGIKLIRINNHQYLYHATVYRECLCHYEDCDYCKEHRNY